MIIVGPNETLHFTCGEAPDMLGQSKITSVRFLLKLAPKHIPQPAKTPQAPCFQDKAFEDLPSRSVRIDATFVSNPCDQLLTAPPAPRWPPGRAPPFGSQGVATPAGWR